MNAILHPARPHRRPGRLIRLVRLCSLPVLAFLVACSTGQAAEKDDAYLEIFNLIQQGDALLKSGKTNNAFANYQRAETALLNFRKAYPDWNVKTVTFRLGYLASRIEVCTPKAVPAALKDSQPETKTAVAASSSLVKLLEAGAEPRKVLRLHPQTGDRQTLSMTLQMAMEMQVGEMPSQAVKVPPIKLPVQVSVKDVSAEGDITYEMMMGEASLAEEAGSTPQAGADIKASLAALKGLTGTGVMSSLGIVKSTEVNAPAGADPQLRQALDQMRESLSQMATPVPEEPVGIGARWEVSRPVKSQGMTIAQTATYELTSVDDDRITVKSAIGQSAANQKIENPSMPGMKLDVAKMTGRSSGDLKLDLAHAMPSEGIVNSHTEIAMGMNVGGQKQSMNMKMDLNLRLESQ